MNITIHFLTVEQVVTFHKKSLLLFGGASGIRDQNLLDSAVIQPMLTAMIIMNSTN